MWAQTGQQALLALIGLSAGVVVAGGLFSFIVELGVVADFADRTHTADKILLYESSVAFGGILGNSYYVFKESMACTLDATGAGGGMLAVFGIFAGIFVGCWAMALAEILNVFPVFMRRTRIVKYMAAFILAVAIGKGAGAYLFFFKGW